MIIGTFCLINGHWWWRYIHDSFKELSTHNRIIDIIQTFNSPYRPTLQTAVFSKPLSVLAIKSRVSVFDRWRQIKGTRRRRRWYQLRRRRQTPLIFSHVVLRLLTTHISISVSYRWIRISWKWRTWSNTSIAKVLLYEIHWIRLDNFSIETRLKTVNSGGKT